MIHNDCIHRMNSRREREKNGESSSNKMWQAYTAHTGNIIIITYIFQTDTLETSESDSVSPAEIRMQRMQSRCFVSMRIGDLYELWTTNTTELGYNLLRKMPCIIQQRVREEKTAKPCHARTVHIVAKLLHVVLYLLWLFFYDKCDRC